MFVLNPAMLLVGATFVQVIQFVITSMIGMFAIAGGLEGFMKRRLPIWQKNTAVGGGLMMIEPRLITDIIGIVIIGIIVVLQYAVKEPKPPDSGQAL
jgi:TRAP-type uncharacterized transport system fused permease subunit